MSVKVISNCGNPYTKDVLDALDEIEKRRGGFPKRRPKNKDPNLASKQPRYNIGVKTDYHAFVLGKVKWYFGKGLVESKYNRRFPDFFKLLRKWVKWKFPSHRWNAIQINKGVNTGYHYDRNNVGNSLCIGIGDFKGGGITCELKNGKKNIDNKNKWLVYNGKEIRHKTIPATSGIRYAIIFYYRNTA
jgi:hypothetical protein